MLCTELVNESGHTVIWYGHSRNDYQLHTHRSSICSQIVSLFSSFDKFYANRDRRLPILFFFSLEIDVLHAIESFIELEEQMIVHWIEFSEYKLVLISNFYSNYQRKEWLRLVFNQTEWDYTKIMFQRWAHLIRSHSIRFLLTQSIDLNVYYTVCELTLSARQILCPTRFFFFLLGLWLFTIYGIRHAELIP